MKLERIFPSEPGLFLGYFSKNDLLLALKRLKQCANIQPFHQERKVEYLLGDYYLPPCSWHEFISKVQQVLSDQATYKPTPVQAEILGKIETFPDNLLFFEGISQTQFLGVFDLGKLTMKNFYSEKYGLFIGIENSEFIELLESDKSGLVNYFDSIVRETNPDRAVLSETVGRFFDHLWKVPEDQHYEMDIFKYVNYVHYLPHDQVNDDIISYLKEVQSPTPKQVSENLSRVTLIMPNEVTNQWRRFSTVLGFHEQTEIVW